MSLDSSGSAGIAFAGRMEDLPDPEVAVRAKARTFTAAYKKRILAEYESAPRGDRGALLRREALYSTLIHKWQLQAARGGATGLSGRAPGPKPDPSARALAAAARRIERLETELAKSRRINDVQAKLSALLEDLFKGADIDGKPTN